MSTKNKLNKRSIDKKLRKYIKEHLSKGYSKDNIKKVLANHGYNEPYINGLLRKHAEVQFVKKYAFAVSLLFIIFVFFVNLISRNQDEKVTGYAAAFNASKGSEISKVGPSELSYGSSLIYDYEKVAPNDSELILFLGSKLL